jgi:hypothetical protein
MRLTVTEPNTGTACQDPTTASANLFIQFHNQPALKQPHGYISTVVHCVTGKNAECRRFARNNLTSLRLSATVWTRSKHDPDRTRK